ncbi:protoporphyrinogen oxidase HemJ [Breoghania sp.]|uniref:protoporphyrinogen oxidase HemJ n=1 Tax=Breoghania sp. TaxID=2065378 RepID=UPI00262AF63D|nr:protoporphyrinogen oxidase HemJ [Breoghania sp.]MDJ0930417.1 protoporphyrinogen oxidase HemJ [Breoghania sp.]
MSDDLVLLLKSFHIMSVIAWMAGFFYLPRLMVYHTKAEIGSETSEIFKVMERRLMKAIMNPAMIASWIFGLVVAWEYGYLTEGWFHLKLLLVFILSGFHDLLAKHVKDFAADANQHSEKYFRVINEFPTLIMIVVVLLVILKPYGFFD